MSLNNIQEILAVGRTSNANAGGTVAFKSYNLKVLDEKIFYYHVCFEKLLRYSTRICNKKWSVSFKKFDLTYK